MKKILNAIAQVIFDKKGTNILAINVEGISSLTDYLLIAEGTVDRHVKALCHTVLEKLEEQGIKPIVTEGIQEGDWIVLDYGDFIVHLFTPEMRERYALAEVWKKGKIVDLDLIIGKAS